MLRLVAFLPEEGFSFYLQNGDYFFFSYQESTPQKVRQSHVEYIVTVIGYLAADVQFSSLKELRDFLRQEMLSNSSKQEQLSTEELQKQLLLRLSQSEIQLMIDNYCDWLKEEEYQIYFTNLLRAKNLTNQQKELIQEHLKNSP